MGVFEPSHGFCAKENNGGNGVEPLPVPLTYDSQTKCGSGGGTRRILMDATTELPRTPASAEVSLVRGGPFYRAQRAIGLIRPNQWNLGRRITFLIVVGWLPLLLITAVSNLQLLPSLLRDYRVHARMLIAVPALLVGEILMESRFRAVIGHIHQASLLDASDLARVDEFIAY